VFGGNKETREDLFFFLAGMLCAVQIFLARNFGVLLWCRSRGNHAWAIVRHLSILCWAYCVVFVCAFNGSVGFC